MHLNAHDVVHGAFIYRLPQPDQNVGGSPHSFYASGVETVATVLPHLGHQQARLFSLFVD
jgi:hypothetical protein